ncbi:MAG TPA: serine/threonine-protein kinase, partial [Planctomycetota bacterium]|nr:serine/threonine-protein kinase [Planctomycetota bacterium]
MDRRALEEAPTREAGPLLLTPGERIAGSYQVCSLIGQGGMSQVFEAEDLGLRRRVAIKVNIADPDGLELQREGQALSAVRHPGLPVVHGLGQHKGFPYLVMERLYGVSLEEDLRRASAGGRPFPLGDALDILIAVADVLGEVHRAGLAHRDVKPGNLMLCPRGRVVLLDFGIFQAEIQVSNTEVCGTPRYMAPELITREVEPGQGHLLDTYAFGAVACELLIGRPPFDSSNFVEILELHLGGALPDLGRARPDAPPELISLVTACLAKAADDRPPSMDELAAELRVLARRLVHR